MTITRLLILITFYKPKNYIALFYSYNLEKESKNDEKIVYKLYILKSNNYLPLPILLVLMNASIPCIQPKVTADMNEHLLQPYSPEEIRQALIQMHLTKTPGLDGFPALFYQRYWHIVSNELGQSFFNSGHLLRKANYTHIQRQKHSWTKGGNGPL